MNKCHDPEEYLRRHHVDAQSAVGSGEIVLPPSNDLEVIFCLALLNVLELSETQKVLECYISMRNDSERVLESVGRRQNDQAER